jgi:hypothetical protein
MGNLYALWQWIISTNNFQNERERVSKIEGKNPNMLLCLVCKVFFFLLNRLHCRVDLCFCLYGGDEVFFIVYYIYYIMVVCVYKIEPHGFVKKKEKKKL